MFNLQCQKILLPFLVQNIPILQEHPDHVGGGRPAGDPGGLGGARAALEAAAAVLPEGHRAQRGPDEAYAHRPQEPSRIQGRRDIRLVPNVEDTGYIGSDRDSRTLPLLLTI